MFSVGDRVVHPGQGLCTVVEVREARPEGGAGASSGMLVLEAKSGRSVTRLMCPADKAAEMLRPPVSRAQALEVIRGYAAMEPDPFTDHNSGLEERHFKALVKRGVPESLRAVKTVRGRIAAAEAAGKKPSTYLARVLREARRRSLEELSDALSMEPEEVAGLFGKDAADFSDEA